mgnify:CR=1 FL=1
MPIVSFKEILQDAFDKRYGVPAFNIVNDLTLEAVLSALELLRKAGARRVIPLAVAAIVFAVANRQWITVSFDPFNRDAPFAGGRIQGDDGTARSGQCNW